MNAYWYRFIDRFAATCAFLEEFSKCSKEVFTAFSISALILEIFWAVRHHQKFFSSCITLSTSYDTYPWAMFLFYFILFSFATRAGSQQQLGPITVGPYYLTHLVNFPCGGKIETGVPGENPRFSAERWLYSFHMRNEFEPTLRWILLTTQNLRGERQVVWPLHYVQAISFPVVSF